MFAPEEVEPGAALTSVVRYITIGSQERASFDSIKPYTGLTATRGHSSLPRLKLLNTRSVGVSSEMSVVHKPIVLVMNRSQGILLVRMARTSKIGNGNLS